ncbi:MAG: tetraacyldisaccharide 4'-kinase [Gammaproteobacteria bacterium]
MYRYINNNPLSWLFRLIAYFRRVYYKLFHSKSLGRTKIIVVGNITVGGTGKTPFVAYLAKLILENDLKIGIISRGYRRVNEGNLIEVLINSDVNEVGDEALMLKQQVTCPIAVAADRVEAARYINDKYELDVLFLMTVCSIISCLVIMKLLSLMVSESLVMVTVCQRVHCVNLYHV